MQQPIAGYALVEHAHVFIASALCKEPLGQEVGPSPVGIHRRGDAVSNRITQTDNRSAGVRSVNFHVGQEVVGLVGGIHRRILHPGLIATQDVVGLQARRVLRRNRSQNWADIC